MTLPDIRLEDEKQVEFSGFDLSRELPDYIPRVIYTAYEDNESIKRAFAEEGAKASLNKRDPKAPAKLIETVDRLFASNIKVNFNLKFPGSFKLDSLARQIQIPVEEIELQPTQDDVRQVLQALFNEAVAVKVDFLLRAAAAPAFTQSGSVLVKAQPQFKHAWATSVVIKFGARDDIMQEARNYEIIEPFLGGKRRADLRGAAFSRQIGALLYSLIDAEDLEAIRVFDDVFLNNNAERVIGLLQQLFSQTFRQLFNDARRETIDLTTTYVNALGLTPEKLRMSAEEFHPGVLGEPQVRFKGLQGAFLNPIVWSLQDDKFRQFEVLSRVCLCHGDLHGRNILVDAGHRFWLIGFARVAESHALRDFAELETDIKFNLLPIVDLAALLPFEQALLVPAHFRDVLPVDLFHNDRLDHAYQTVLTLRRIASELIELEGDMREYYQALFFHTLNILRLRHISTDKKEHALLSAALISQRLDNWPRWEYEPPPGTTTPTTRPPPSKRHETSPSGSPGARRLSDDQRRWGIRLVGGSLFFLLGAGVIALWSPIQSVNPNLIGASAFLLLGAGVVALLWWAMQSFKPSWQGHIATLLYISIFIIAAFGILGLVGGAKAIEALQEIISNLFPKK